MLSYCQRLSNDGAGAPQGIRVARPVGRSTENVDWRGSVGKGAGRGESMRHGETEKICNVAGGWRLSSEKLLMCGRQGVRSDDAYNPEDPMQRQDVRSRTIWNKLHVDLRHLSKVKLPSVFFSM